MPQSLIPNEMGVGQDKRVVFFQSALDEKRYRALRVIETRVGIDAAGLYDDLR